MQEMRVLHDAIVGDPSQTMNGEMVVTGFKNDIGRFPRDLVELVTANPFDGMYAALPYIGKETLPAWDPYIKKGWNGPYVREDGDMGYRYDSWGNAYRFLVDGTETLGLQSAGPDGLFLGQPGARDSDDIKVRF